MNHLAPRLGRDERTRRVALVARGGRLVGHDEPPVAARPVGATEPRVVQTHPRAEHHDGERERGSEARESYEGHIHRFDPDTDSRRRKSRKSSFWATSAG